MRVYKVELLIVDSDEVGEREIPIVIENVRYPNHCLSPHVMSITGRDVDWSDEHPLNKTDTMEQEYIRLFGGSR